MHNLLMLLTPLLAAWVASCAAPTMPDSANAEIRMDCRGTLMSFEWGWLEIETDAVITIHADGRQLTYEGRRFAGTYSITRNDEDSVVFRGGSGIEGGVNRHTGRLVISTSDAKHVVNLVCQPATPRS
jgi:hypothetical protein